MKLSTQNYHLIALRAFLDYLKKVGLTTLPAESVMLNKIKRQPIMYVEGSDLDKLLDAPLHTKNSRIIQTRDKAILELLFSTGLKVSEISSLRRAQIKFNLSEIAIPNDTNSSRTIPLTNLVKYWLKQYLEARIDSAPALFVRHDKAKKTQHQNMDYSLTPRTIQRIVKKYTKSTGLDSKITPQSLRHSYAHKQLALGADLKSLQALLGHSSITTTRAYKNLKHD
ncbi:tyrosine-type recombinase/integrase [Patescibacteria group bacterium]|nr:tyrosine-type recombinase/integrase [Patescibacteria group bacterium]